MGATNNSSFPPFDRLRINWLSAKRESSLLNPNNPLDNEPTVGASSLANNFASKLAPTIGKASIGHPSGSQLAVSDGLNPISYPPGSESPLSFHPNLSWSHYRALMRVENNAARQFYETEAVQSNWSRRDLERQIGSLFYERLLASTDKTATLRRTPCG